jgi:hypothetical protein
MYCQVLHQKALDFELTETVVVFLIKAHCVLCEVRTEPLFVKY